MPTGLPDWWRKHYFVGQEEGLWSILSWAARAGYYRGFAMFVGISSGNYTVYDIITVPSGKTFFLTGAFIGAEYEPAIFWFDLKDTSGTHYVEMVVHNQITITFPIPIPVASGRKLQLQLYGYDSTGGGAYTTIQGFLI